jgi:hypothetical protein
VTSLIAMLVIANAMIPVIRLALAVSTLIVWL